MSEQLDDLGLSRTFRSVNGRLVVVDVDKIIEPASSGGQAQLFSSQLNAVVDSKYKVLSLLGEGGMGSVYRVRHLLLDKEMALKTFRTAKLTPDTWARFQREAQAIGKLSHINIVQVFDFGIGEQNLPYYTMELLAGEPLADRLKRVTRVNINETLEIFIAVASGMAHAHGQGIVHRDIKPSNIFMQRGRDRDTPKIVDFGLAKLATAQSMERQSLTAKGLIFGSPLYMSPEQSLGIDTDQRTDIYSFGCSLFHALTGTPPFVGQSLLATISMHHNQSPQPLAEAAGGAVFPERLEDIVQMLLQKDPVDRYQTMLEVQSEMRKVLSGKSINNTRSTRPKDKTIPRAAEELQKTKEPDVKAGLPRIVLFAGLASVIVVAGLTLGYITKIGQPINQIKRRQAAPKGPVQAASIAAEPGPGPGSKFDEYESKLINVADRSMAAMVWDGKPFFKGIVQGPGRPSKLWCFPPTVAPGLGCLFAVTDPANMVPMAGNVYFPPAASVCLMPNSGVLVYPDLGNGFTDGNFDGLALSTITKIKFRRLATILAKLKSIHSLYIYNIEDADDAFESSTLQVINDYPNLTRLRVDTLVDGRSVRRIRRLKMLQYLQLGAVKKNDADLFASIRGLDRLTELRFLDVPLTIDAFKDICTCPNLENLKFFMKQRKIQIQGFELEPLASLKKLKSLKLESVCYSPTLIQALGKCRSLTTLECQLDSQWSRGQRLALRQALPNTDLWLYWQGVGEDIIRLHYAPGQNQPGR